MPADLPRLNASQLHALALAAPAGAGCSGCAAVTNGAWDALPAGFDERVLERVATLRSGEDEPSWTEYHPQGTRLWSPDAPIAPDHHPANRSDVARCRHCGRVFLRYTEAGGYFSEVRLRPLAAALVVLDAPAPG